MGCITEDYDDEDFKFKFQDILCHVDKLKTKKLRHSQEKLNKLAENTEANFSLDYFINLVKDSNK